MEVRPRSKEFRNFCIELPRTGFNCLREASNNHMPSKSPDFDAEDKEEQESSKLRRPKRGAIPSPKADIEAATPYSPENPPPERSAPEADAPIDDRQKEENQDSQ